MYQGNNIKETVTRIIATINFSCDIILPPRKFIKNMLEKKFISYSALPDIDQIGQKLFIYDQRQEVRKNVEQIYLLGLIRPEDNEYKRELNKKVKRFTKELKHTINSNAEIEVIKHLKDNGEQNFYINFHSAENSKTENRFFITKCTGNSVDIIRNKLSNLISRHSIWNWTSDIFQKKNGAYCSIFFGITSSYEKKD